MKSHLFKATIHMLGPITWLALAAGLQMLGALLYFKLPPDAILIVTYFLIAFSVYLFNRFTDDEDSLNDPDRKMFFKRRPAYIAFPLILFLMSLIILILKERLVLWHVVLIAGGIGYSAEIIPLYRKKTLYFIRLKDMLFIKNAVVSLLWGITPFMIAASQKYAVVPEHGALIITVTAFCLSTLINTTACDIPDASGDLAEGVKTIPTIFGEKNTLLFLLVVGIVVCCSVGTALLLGKTDIGPVILFLAIILWTGTTTFLVLKKKDRFAQWLIKPILDSQYVVCGVALIIYSFLIY